MPPGAASSTQLPLLEYGACSLNRPTAATDTAPLMRDAISAGVCVGFPVVNSFPAATAMNTPFPTA